MSNITQQRVFGGTVQLLALCPLLAVSDTVVKALGFSIVVLIIVPLSTLLLGAIRRLLDDSITLAATLLITAGLVTASELILRAWFHDLGASFNVFLPLLAVNIIIVNSIQAQRADLSPPSTRFQPTYLRPASDGPQSLQPPPASEPPPPGRDNGLLAFRHSLRISLGIAFSLLALGFARELVGRGSLLNGAGAMLAPWAERLEVKVFSVDMGFLLAMLPPGAFISLGLLIAARNWLASRHAS